MNVWLTIYRIATALLIVLMVGGVLLLFAPKLRQNRARQREIVRLEEENRLREEMIQELRLRQERFVSDPQFVERIAREELGKAKPGEIIFKFTNQPEQ